MGPGASCAFDVPFKLCIVATAAVVPMKRRLRLKLQELIVSLLMLGISRRNYGGCSLLNVPVQLKFHPFRNSSPCRTNQRLLPIKATKSLQSSRGDLGGSIALTG
jgi:hypothetical protein